MLHKYLAMYAAKLLQDGGAVQRVLTLYAKHGAPAVQSNLNIYKKCFIDVCQAPNSHKPESYSLWGQLRDMLLQVVRTVLFYVVILITIGVFIDTFIT